MNATVTRSIAKNAGTGNTKKLAARTAAPKSGTSSKPAGKSLLKTVQKLAKAETGPLKTSVKASTAKTVAKAPKTTVKSIPAEKTARKSAVKTAAAKRPAP